jgi:maltooligosyltrehalose trehalohydrolase
MSTPTDPSVERCPGAWIDTDQVAHFRVWAPGAQTVEVVLADATLAMQRESSGYFILDTASLSAGALYRYRVDGGGPWPDPCSRFQPDGPHGPSQLVAPQAYRWRDAGWRGVQLYGQVIYELHIGTFTSAGTFDAAQKKLEWLKELGVTLIEVMPIAEFPGNRGWGYDGVQLFAPFHHYGDHEALKRFVDAAHAIGLGVILDVVYNHLGPDGNYLRCFSEAYFTRRHKTEWGDAWNFDGEQSRGARDLLIHNACYWLRDFHLDGFRLDATQAIIDDGPRHVLTELVENIRAVAAPREIIVIAEDQPQRGYHLKPAIPGGWAMDGMWNDDFHHAARVALTGDRDAYYHDFSGRSQEFVSAVRHGFLFQGQYYYWQQQRRGSPLRHVPAQACIQFLQNHDQVSNTFDSRRVHLLAQAGQYRALTALLLLGPQTPMLFMGQEFLSSSPFPYFIDHHAELAQLVEQGRKAFLRQFRAYDNDAAQACVADPADEATFLSAKLNWEEAQTNDHAVQMHRDLLRLRRDDPVIAAQDSRRIDGATLSERAFVVRWFDDEHGDRLLIVNLAQEIVLDPAPEPLLAPALNRLWHMHWCSEEPRYGGIGATSPCDAEGRWRIAANCACLLYQVERT